MSDEEKSTGEAAAGTAAASEQPVEERPPDEHTTAPNPPKPQTPAAPPKWEMPKPVFRNTSGYLPQGFLKDMQSPPAETEPSSPDALPTSPPAKIPDLSAVNLSTPAAPAAAIEPQPDLSEILAPDDQEFETAPEPPKKSGGIRAPMVLLGLVAILAFIAVFLTVIYFLFLKGSGGN